VSVSRKATQEGATRSTTRRRASTLRHSKLMMAMMMGILIISWIAALIGLISLFGTGHSWESFTPLAARAAASPGAITVFDSTPVQLTPIKNNTTPVGAAVFNLATNRCYIVLLPKAPESDFTTLASQSSSYATSYPDPLFPRYYRNTTSSNLSTVRAAHSPGIVATTPQKTQTACATLAATMTSP
jgi:hypothetical protein